MNPPSTNTAADRLGACLMRLVRLARNVAAPDFLGVAVELVREVVPFRSGWWGLGADKGAGEMPSIHQVGLLDLPDRFVADWVAIALQDDTLDALRTHVGKVVRYHGADERGLARAVLEFDRRYAIGHSMALALDTTGTGHMFFISVFRGRGDTPFSEADATLFRNLLENVIQLWHFCLQDALSASLRRAAPLRSSAIVAPPGAGADVAGTGQRTASAALARADGRLLYAGPLVCELFHAQWPGWEGVALPDEIIGQLGAAPCALPFRDGMLSLHVQGEHVWLVRTGQAPEPAASPLSPRERRVALLFAAGQSYKEIARTLNLAPATVRTYLRDAYLRLGVSNKIQLGEMLNGGREH